MKCIGLVIALFFSAAMSGFAADTVEPVQDKVGVEIPDNALMLNSLQAYWVFSGQVANENGERFNYYFQMQRKENTFQSTAVLIESSSKAVLLFEHNQATLKNPESTNWRVGESFMHFNPINNSWTFGVKSKSNKGFNFKVDMLGQPQNASKTQNLRDGVELLVNQTGHLNGHIQTGQAEKEQFVTAQKAWLKQVWVNQEQDSTHPLTSVLCQFNDGSAFYALNLQEADALRGAVAGWRDEQGASLPMSQFVSVNEGEKGGWQISIPSPKMHLKLEDALAKDPGNKQLIAGITQGEMPGFCVISKDEVG